MSKGVCKGQKTGKTIPAPGRLEDSAASPASPAPASPGAQRRSGRELSPSKGWEWVLRMERRRVLPRRGWAARARTPSSSRARGLMPMGVIPTMGATGPPLERNPACLGQQTSSCGEAGGGEAVAGKPQGRVPSVSQGKVCITAEGLPATGRPVCSHGPTLPAHAALVQGGGREVVMLQSCHDTEKSQRKGGW